MSQLRNIPKSKRPLPVDEPHPGEKLVIQNFSPDNSGFYTWHYARLTKSQIARISNNPHDRAIELRIKNFDVSQLPAVVNNLPRNANAIKLLLVVELDEAFAGATEHAVQLIRNVGIPDHADLPGVWFLAERDGVVEAHALHGNMRRALFSALEVEFDERKVDGNRVLQFWEDIAAIRMGKWEGPEMERYVHVKWAVISKLERNAKSATTVGVWVGVIAVVVAGVTGALWTSGQI